VLSVMIADDAVWADFVESVLEVLAAFFSE
jgi:hypothetical protein